MTVLDRTLVRELPEHLDQRVRLSGWVHRRRRLAAVTFLVLRDRSGLAQVVVKDADVRGRLDAIGEESVLSVAGRVVANAQAPGGVEVLHRLHDLVDGLAHAEDEVRLGNQAVGACSRDDVE